VTLHSTGDVFHCERCDGVSILRSRLLGSRASTHENIKVNQSRNIRVTDSLISGAEQNALDFVAVRGVRLRRNIFERAEDWCVYTKGGSSNVVVTDNVFRHCGTGGYLAGQGSGLQYMVAPFLHYEAVGVTVARNTFRDITGAAFGVNGAYNAMFADNVAYRTGRRSHLFEAQAGGRTCDGATRRSAVSRWSTPGLGGRRSRATGSRFRTATSTWCATSSPTRPPSRATGSTSRSRARSVTRATCRPRPAATTTCA
jgi:hypothetical protein